jgi:hypothetical protein
MEIIQHKHLILGVMLQDVMPQGACHHGQLQVRTSRPHHTWYLDLCRGTGRGMVTRFRLQEGIGTREKLQAGEKVGAFGKRWSTQIVWGRGAVHMPHGGLLLCNSATTALGSQQ